MNIAKDKYCNDHGLKRTTVEGWMQRHWTKGQHYYVIGHTTMINTDEVETWIKDFQQASDRVETGLKSKSGNTVSQFTKKSSRQTQTMRLTLDG